MYFCYFQVIILFKNESIKKKLYLIVDNNFTYIRQLNGTDSCIKSTGIVRHSVCIRLGHECLFVLSPTYKNFFLNKYLLLKF